VLNMCDLFEDDHEEFVLLIKMPNAVMEPKVHLLSLYVRLKH